MVCDFLVPLVEWYMSVTVKCYHTEYLLPPPIVCVCVCKIKNYNYTFIAKYKLIACMHSLMYA